MALFVAMTLVCASASLSTEVTASIIRQGKSWVVVDGIRPGAAAVATYDDTVMTIGWGLLHVNTSSAFSDADQV